jgi:hypothetical protein
MFAEFMAANPTATPTQLYDKAVSIAQNRNLRGLMLNTLVAYSYGRLFRPYGVETEVKVTRDRRDIDVLFRLPRGLLYVSATTVPQERKKTDWAAEIDTLKHYHQRQKTPTSYLFLGLMGNGTTNPVSYEKSKKTLEKFKTNLGNGGFEIVSLDCVAEHSETLARIAANFG